MLSTILPTRTDAFNGFRYQSGLNVRSVRKLGTPRRNTLSRNDEFDIFQLHQTFLRSCATETASVAVSSSLKAIARLITTLSVGAGFAHVGSLPKTSLGVLSGLIYGIFQPSLLFSNVAKTLTGVGGGKDAIKKLIVLPLFSVIQIVCGYLIGKALLKLRYKNLSQDDPDYKEILLSSTFGNSGPLPFLFVDAMNMGPTAIGYISLCLLGWSPLFWTLGPRLLNPSSDDNKSLSKVLLTPPNMGCLAGALVGSTAMNKLLMGPDAFFSPIMSTIGALGNAYLPCVGLTLAGTLYYSLLSETNTDTADQKNEHSISLWSKVFTLALIRFVAMPLLGVGIISFFTNVSMIPRNDKLLRFILMLQCCMPSAQNGVVILQLSEDTRHLAGSMAKTISSLYLCSMIPLAILIQFAYRFAGF